MNSSRTSLRRLKRGDRPTASEWNAIVDALTRTEINSDRASGPASVPFQGTVALVRNDTGSTLARFSPFRLDKLYPASPNEIFNPTSHAGAFVANMPVAAQTAAGNLIHHSVGVTLEPIAVDGFGRAAIAGAVPCAVNVGSTSHRYARLKTDSLTQLESCEYGPVEIVWNTGTAGYQFSIVKLGTMPAVFFPVKVTKTGGSYGTDTTPCTATYSVNDLSGVALGVNMTPAKPRGTGGVVATIPNNSYGVGFYDTSGAFVLWDAGEVPNQYPAIDTDT